ncbi:hypothetical protein PILCRDRAFT_828311 [Piloderma croceum F 1598]|uniref:Uncharacterized protein n=1 Tax=Piloderma croceum (strain F 1598) TaxID=765440 RepID=A0A0C3AKA0_PILCF|nr:hypothetical protein PILCRDRAFT_828311 [Piloderma croceum F 1598]
MSRFLGRKADTELYVEHKGLRDSKRVGISELVIHVLPTGIVPGPPVYLMIRLCW